MQLFEMYLYEGKRRGILNSGIVFLRTVLVLMSEHLVLWCFGGQSLNEAIFQTFHLSPVRQVHFLRAMSTLEEVVLSYSAHRPANIADSFQMFNIFLNSTFKL